MEPRTAAKGRKPLFLAAVCVLASLLAVPAADASRTLPRSLEPASTPPAPSLDALVDAGDAGRQLGLLTAEDRLLFEVLAGLEPSEVDRVVSSRRLGLYHRFGALPHPLEQAAILKLASGVETWGTRPNVWQKSDLTQESRWTLDLYAFVAWGPHRATDPMGLADDWNYSYGGPKDPEVLAERRRKAEEWCQANPRECAAENARVSGVLMMGAGLLEGVGGMAGCYFTGSLGCFAGAALVTHGADTMDTGWQMWRTGAPQETRTFRLFEAGYGTFLSPQRAAIAARSTEILGPAFLGAGMARSAMSVQARAPALFLGAQSATKQSAQATSRGFSLFGRRALARRMLQRHTTRASNRLASNPALAQDVLSDAEYAAGQRNYRVAPMQFGNAEERLAAETIEESFFSSRLIEHVGGPSNPDFVGRGLFRGLNFDITTPGQVEAHLARPGYGQGLIISTYERPQSFRLFPATPAEGLPP